MYRLGLHRELSIQIVLQNLPSEFRFYLNEMN